MDVQQLRAAVPHSMLTWAWRIGRGLALVATCGLGVLGGAVVVTLHLLGWMSMGWTVVISLAVVALAVTAAWQLSVIAAQRREAQQREMIAGGL